MSKETVTEELLIQYLANEVNEREKQSVEEWLREEHNRKHFEQLKAIWMLTAAEYPSGVDSESSWRDLQDRLKPKIAARRTISWSWGHIAKVAAVLLALTGIGAWLYLSSSKRNDQAVAVYQSTSTPVKNIKQTQVPDTDEQSKLIAINRSESPGTQVTETPIQVTPARQELSVGGEKRSDIVIASQVKEQVCNNTQCPLEICIVQSLICGDNKSSTYAHCSMLQPDESGQLRYHENPDCNSLVEEIRIKRITTGETIVLTPKSSPVTAQEFFDYMTGDKTGTIVAGIFETDCNNDCTDQSIRLDNRLGVPIIQ